MKTLIKIYKLSLIFILLSTIYANLIRPSNLDILHSIHGLFEWDQEPNVLQYNLQISNDSLFNNIIVDTTTSKLMYYENQKLEWDNTYFWRVAPIYEERNFAEWIGINSFNTGLPKNNVTIIENLNENLMQDGFTIYGDGKQNASIMYDKFGQEIWNDGYLNTKLLHINKFGQMYSSGLDDIIKIPIKFNFNHDIVWQGSDSLESTNGMNTHDLKEMPNGNFLYTGNYHFLGPIPLGPWTSLYQDLGYEANGETLEFDWRSTRLHEIDRNNLEIVKIWDANDYFSIDIYDSLGGTWNWGSNFGYFDWLHQNSIWYDEIDNSVYMSFRHISRIIKIDYSTGDIIWMMGLPDEFTTSNFDDHICTELLFSFQHDAKILDNGNLLIYDNGNLSQIVRDTENKTTRILEVEIIDNNLCNVVWEYNLPNELYASSRGNVTKLNNNNYLINCATESGHIIEVSPNKEIVWKLNLNNSGNYSIANYRAFRLPSVYPDAYYVTFDNLVEINDTLTAILLNEGYTFSIKIFNESGYTQDYYYNLFNIKEEIISIEAFSSRTINFQIENLDILEIDLTIYPISHEYAKKQFNYHIIDNSSYLDDNIETFKLYDPFPNPFNNAVNIVYDIPYSIDVNISIYNLNGQLVENLFNHLNEKGRYYTTWNVSNLSSGIYFIKMSTEDFTTMKKVSFLK